MNTRACVVWLAVSVAWLVLTVAAMGAGPVGEKASVAGDDRAEAVIDVVEKACLEDTVCMIGRKKAERLAELVRERKPRLVVECGTALGYSGLWIARELKRAGKGKLITIEISPERAKLAAANFRKAGLEEYVTVKTGDAREVVKKIKGSVDFVFIDCGYANYLLCLKGLEEQLSRGAVVVADNVGIGSDGMKDYLEEVRSKYQSRTEWFDLDLPWAKRDAMEVSFVTQQRRPFLDWPEDQGRTLPSGLPAMTSVLSSTYDQYLAQKREGRISAEAIRGGYVYWAIVVDRDVRDLPTGDGGTVSAWIFLTERYKAAIPEVQSKSP